MKNIIKITRSQALSMFLNYNKEVSASGVAFSNLTYMVDEGKSKTVGGKKAIQKLVEVNATIGSDYEKKVNRIVDKEGKEIDFVAQPMNGKEYVSNGNPVAKDTRTGEKRYLIFIVENHSKAQVRYFLNSNEVDKGTIWNDQYITPAGLNPKTYTSGRDSINKENDFAFRTLDFKNLKAFNMNGNAYIVID